MNQTIFHMDFKSYRMIKLKKTTIMIPTSGQNRSQKPFNLKADFRYCSGYSAGNLIAAIWMGRKMISAPRAAYDARVSRENPETIQKTERTQIIVSNT